jgi:hypothetical protein
MTSLSNSTKRKFAISLLPTKELPILIIREGAITENSFTPNLPDN